MNLDKKLVRSKNVYFSWGVFSEDVKDIGHFIVILKNIALMKSFSFRIRYLHMRNDLPLHTFKLKKCRHNVNIIKKPQLFPSALTLKGFFL